MYRQLSSYSITIIGGDQRQTLLYDSLKQQGYQVSGIALEPSPYIDMDPSCFSSTKLQASDLWITGIPFSKDGIHLFSKAAPKAISIQSFLFFLQQAPPKLLIGGQFPKEVVAFARTYQIPCHDLLKRQSMAIANAIPTAEGAIFHAMEESVYTIDHAACLVLGFGKCGKALAQRLQGLHGKVTVCTRSEEDLAYAASCGYQTLPFSHLQKQLPSFLFIFNTIPAPVMGPKRLALCHASCVIIDIASQPGGVDFTYAVQHKLNAKLCPGLPGKMAPKSAALILEEQILRLFSCQN